MADIFISYEKSMGKEYADHIRTVLEETGFKTFLDNRDIEIGAEWLKKIEKAIDECSIFILILTEGVKHSDYIKFEFQRGIVLKKRILPFKFATLSNGGIPEDMRKLQYVEFNTKEELARKVIVFVSPEAPLAGKPIQIEIERVHLERIFLNRRPYPNSQLFQDISSQLEGKITSSTNDVLLFGNSFRDFFGEDTANWKVRHKDIIIRALNKNVLFKVILLDPTSKAAKERAKVEEGPEVEDDRRYVNSVLFKDIERVTEWLARENSPMIEVRYSTLTPLAFMIRTDEYTFVEQYHLGNLKIIYTNIREEDRKSLCLGGYVPLFMFKNASDISKLMKSHFENMWELMRDNDLKKVFEKTQEFKRDPKSFRMKQFFEDTSKIIINWKN
ncbi:hypothetical protein CO010_00530 [Candidatus Shapirobacteria bacterium CG_4_8_14_3_um_filter_39_11]|uniref:TIR domain-containing protein n=1 Tax=Candidatus Shapirobacteria bacterium CG_4_8_14_3_um_filter_39_11 TaxID=1974875 RepID=A0A2M8GI70_9BACT|nr:MAG: hypothetical protein CO010_00530 [Candidatus Shapirobacteria bacterium CG_4_8_14_3_um_filter_39_11]